MNDIHLMPALQYHEAAFILLGLLCSGIATFFSAALASLGSGRLEEIEQHNPLIADELFNARQFRSRAEHALTFVDFIGIVIAAIFIGNAAIKQESSWHAVLYSSFLVLFSMLFIKALLQGLGDRYADRLAELTATVLGIIVPVTKPFVALMEWITALLSSEQTMDEVREEMEDEITALMDEAVEEGALDASEYRILSNIIQFSDVNVEDVMTPRSVVFGVNGSVAIGDVISMQELQMYSRFPVWESESVDSVIGYAITKDVLRAALDGKHTQPVSSIVREVYYIPENVRLDKALDEFLTRRQHMFVVVDEYGGVEGLITMEDVLEAILGAEIVDEADRVVDMRQLAKHRRDKRIAANIIVRDEPAESKQGDS
ncbi:MAG: DUF21 domain-containing protein [Candidatus Kapabacteria bacterium]|nr:DUF21 domain-containing protein [Candidatus Kapabacteria bacterium]